jgi:putative membrane protein
VPSWLPYLFLAVWVLLGTVLVAFDMTAVGMTMVYVGAGSMAAAGLVLYATDRRKAPAALVQAGPPVLGLIALSLGLLL